MVIICLCLLENESGNHEVNAAFSMLFVHVYLAEHEQQLWRKPVHSEMVIVFVCLNIDVIIVTTMSAHEIVINSRGSVLVGITA